jgi:L,D-transpeptidase ErfK/SrfK
LAGRTSDSPLAVRGALAAAVLVFLAAAFPSAGSGDAGSHDGAAKLAGVYRDVVEDETTYTAVEGDTLLKIAGEFGVDLDYLLRLNPQKKKFLHPGDRFRIIKRTIIPAETDDGIILNIPDRMLYLFRDGALAVKFPAGLGKPGWRTPRGAFRIISKLRDPVWRVPPSIQREMAAQGERVRKVVPPGKDNPLGRWALNTSLPGILIHETIAPSSVYRFRSHGCVRMRGEDAGRLFGLVDKGDTGSIIYRPVKLAVTVSGKIYLEVYSDVYGLSPEPMGEARRMIGSAGLADKVDWAKVEEVVKLHEGIAQDVTKE